MAVALKNKLESIFVSHQLEVILRPLRYGDREAVQRWLSDPYIIQLTFVVTSPGNSSSVPFSEASSDNYLNMLISESSRITFAIEVNGEHVGNVGLKEYSPGKSYSEFFVEIGEADYRGRGVGKAAIAALLDYALEVLGLSEVRLEVLEFNSVAIHVYEQLGFIKTHRTGWHYDRKGQYWQVWGMTLTKERWMLCKKQLLLPVNVVVKPVTV
jgi:diamine N-acetyltransferase